MKRHLAPLLFAGATIASAWACSDDAQKGEMILAIQTDVALPDSVDTLRIEVTANGQMVLASDYAVATSGGLQIPATLGLLDGTPPATPVTIRVIARKAQQVKMLREVVTTIPRERVATLRIPIRWLCDDSAKEVSPNQYGNTKCDPGQTCLGGDCHVSTVDSSALPTYSGGDVFGGGSGIRDGACFDVLGCLDATTTATVESQSCTFPKPAGDATKLNVALHVKDDGICNADRSRCFVVLDHALLDGWSDLGDRVQLPHAVCDRLASGRVLEVVTSDACTTKTERDNVCGCWSSVGAQCTPASAPPDAGSGSTPPSRTFTNAGDLGTSHIGAGAGVLPSGKVLLAGGWNELDGIVLGAELYDPQTKSSVATESLPDGHLWSGIQQSRTLPVLDDGRVLVAGGLIASGTLNPNAVVFDGTKWTATGPMVYPVLAFNPVKLKDGSVLYIGGWDAVSAATLPTWNFNGDGTARSQRYLPGTNTWVQTAGSLSSGRLVGCNALLENGHVQAVGGFPTNTPIQEYDPATDAWTTVGSLAGTTSCNAIYPVKDHKFLLVGDDKNGGVVSLLYDPATHLTSPTVNTPTGWEPRSVALANGDVLAFGGVVPNTLPGLKRAELYVAETNTWVTLPDLQFARAREAMTALLPNGDVLIAGGYEDDQPPPPPTLKSAEIFHP